MFYISQKTIGWIAAVGVAGLLGAAVATASWIWR